MPHDVFVSYASNDRHVADAICGELEQNGIRAWIAPRDVEPGTPWAASIVRAISDSRVFVLVLSSHSNNSQNVIREVERAVQHGLAIVPFRIEDLVLSEAMEYFIATHHWLDAVALPLQPHIESLVGSVRLCLQLSQAQKDGVASPQAADQGTAVRNRAAADQRTLSLPEVKKALIGDDDAAAADAVRRLAAMNTDEATDALIAGILSTTAPGHTNPGLLERAQQMARALANMEQHSRSIGCRILSECAQRQNWLIWTTDPVRECVARFLDQEIRAGTLASTLDQLLGRDSAKVTVTERYLLTFASAAPEVEKWLLSDPLLNLGAIDAFRLCRRLGQGSGTLDAPSAERLVRALTMEGRSYECSFPLTPASEFWPLLRRLPDPRPAKLVRLLAGRCFLHEIRISAVLFLRDESREDTSAETVDLIIRTCDNEWCGARTVVEGVFQGLPVEAQTAVLHSLTSWKPATDTQTIAAYVLATWCLRNLSDPTIVSSLQGAISAMPTENRQCIERSWDDKVLDGFRALGLNASELGPSC